jgi:hypothetical protein
VSRLYRKPFRLFPLILNPPKAVSLALVELVQFTPNLDDRTVRLAKALGAGTVGVNCTSSTNARDTAFAVRLVNYHKRVALIRILLVSRELSRLYRKPFRLFFCIVLTVPLRPKVS